MLATKTKKVLFFQVKTSREKLFRLYQVSKQKFIEKTPLLIWTEDIKTAEFVDQMLWQYPIYSILPHEISTTTSNEEICISVYPHNPNESKAIFNLTKNPVQESFETISTIYEFDDLSSKEKAEISKEKYHFYRAAKFALASF